MILRLISGTLLSLFRWAANRSFRYEIYGVCRRNLLRDGVLRCWLIGIQRDGPRWVCRPDCIAGDVTINPESYRQQSVEDAYDAVTVLLAALLLLGVSLYALS